MIKPKKMRPLIVVFSKAPVPGNVKTRLISFIGIEAACRLHQAFVEDTLTALEGLGGSYDVELHVDFLLAGWNPWPEMRVQSPGDLGTRMLTALADALNQGRPAAAIVGSDSPTLPPSYVSELFHSTTDVALGPSSDGGFYAVCCRRVVPRMFEDVEWSTPDTLQQTLRSIERCGLTWSLGREWYDVDDDADLRRLVLDPALPASTRQVLVFERLINLET